jgi:hypothetical protein
MASNPSQAFRHHLQSSIKDYLLGQTQPQSQDTSSSNVSTAGWPFSKPHNVAGWALKPKDRPLVVSNAPYTSPPKDHVVIRVIDVAVNPIDWIMQDQDAFGLKYPTVFGLDVAGEVVEAEGGGFKVGERVIA